MAVTSLLNDKITSIAIQCQNAAGANVAVPAGDTFTATSASPAVGATVNGTDLVVNALTLPSPATASVAVTVTDSAGDVAYTLTVSYPVPVIDDIAANLAGDVVTEQAAPTTAGP